MITRHISDLLYHHECVIVPGLGGFIKAYKPAQILKTHEFFPPSATIAFNSGLSVNDGILANYIAAVENTSFREALYEIKQWVDKSNSALKQGDRIILEGIGDLFLNASGKIEFIPSMQINFNVDSFGLPVFFAKAVTEKTLVVPEIQPTKKNSKDVRLRRLIPETLKWAAVLAPFIGFALWGSLNSNFADNYIHNYTGMYSWIRSTPGKTAAIKVPEFKNIDGTTPSITDHSQLEFFSRKNISFSPGVVSYTELAKSKVTIADSFEIVTPEATSFDRSFHIVGGAFRDESNALKFIAMLQQQGYPASIVDTTPGGLYIVSMKGFNSYTEAVDQLNVIIKAGFSASWILKKNRS